METKLIQKTAVQFKTLEVGATFIDPMAHPAETLIKGDVTSYIRLGRVGATNVGEQPWLVIPVELQSVVIAR